MNRQEDVRRFYDQHPYPPPVQSLDDYRRGWDDARRRAEHHLFWPSRPYRDDPAILVAGCGTSQAAKHAMRWPAAKVTAIDLSETSVRSTERLKRKYDLKNLDVRQLAIERAGELGARFDLIVCTGVLHHLADPDAGLRALASVLAPHGAMHLMVYAPYGRAGVYMLQDLCRRLGIEATDDGVRELSRVLEALPSGHPLERLLRESPDFRHSDALADALLHPQDRAYSVPQLFELVANAGLTFGRWLRQAPYSARCGVVARVPRLAKLGLAEQYAAVELFRGTMVRHSAIVHHDDTQRVAFDGEAWRRWVPIRMPDTIHVRGVLIQRAHTFKDLFMPIDAAQKRMIDAVDGRRTIEDIAGKSGDAARSFFERLWWQDQVVFATN